MQNRGEEGNLRPDQRAVIENAKRQREEQEDCERRESRNTGNASSNGQGADSHSADRGIGQENQQEKRETGEPNGLGQAAEEGGA